MYILSDLFPSLRDLADVRGVDLGKVLGQNGDREEARSGYSGGEAVGVLGRMGKTEERLWRMVQLCGVEVVRGIVDFWREEWVV